MRLDNSVKGELGNRKKALTAKVRALPDAEIMRPVLEAHVADALVEDFTFEMLSVGDVFTEEKSERRRVTETDPRYLGPTGQSRRRSVEDFIVQVPLVKGSPRWLVHRPAGSFPPLNERTVYDSGRHAIVIRVQDDQRSDPNGSVARRYVEDQLNTLRRYLDATNAQLAVWNESLPTLCKEAISKERERRSVAASRKQALGPPVIPTDAAPIPYLLPRKRRPRVQLEPTEIKRLGGRMYLPTEDFTAALVEMQRSAQFIAEHPAVYALDERGMRDIVLSHLNAAFPAGAAGEAFSKKGMTDIRVVTAVAADTGFGDCVFKAECKVWDGPASAVSAFDQLGDRYLTAAEVRAAIVLFAKPPYERGAVTHQALARLAADFSAEQVDEIAGWPVVRVRHPALPHTLEVAIITM